MSDFDNKDLDVFFSDFAVTVDASTWGTTFEATFGEDFVEFENVTGEQPYLLAPASKVPATRADGDLFTFTHPNTQADVTMKLIDVENADPGTLRLVLARVS